MSTLGLSYLHCTRCGEQTLHREQVCIHCASPYTSAPVVNRVLTHREGMTRDTKLRQARKRSATGKRKNAAVVMHFGVERALVDIATEAKLPYMIVYGRYKQGDRDGRLVRPVADRWQDKQQKPKCQDLRHVSRRPAA